jgi:cell division cycle 14
VFLIGAYAILMENRTPSKVLTWFAPLINHGHILPYLDVTGHNFTISLFECWYAIHRGNRQQLWPSFEVPEIRRYEHLSEAVHGDLSWMIADKLLAFGSPVDPAFNGGDQLQGKSKIITHEPAFYIKLFQQMHVKVVVRTCKPEYQAQDFLDAGFAHHDLYFVDGSVPPMDLVNQFLEIMVHAPGAVALHCKAGLGRTGTLACAYLMRYYGFSAAESIAYCRIRRPGCVIGEQQTFLKNIEPQLKGLYGTFEKKKRQIPDSGHNDHYDSDASGSYDIIHAPKAKKKRLALPSLEEDVEVFENSSSNSTI